ncbi:alpha/beta fold hydrolase [Actinoplanes missouriensis]|uniref:thioesterase II family protein n=1 Tax=Actinoplanes missouriensis TaxID=1866 RepID=UPI0033EB4478
MTAGTRNERIARLPVDKRAQLVARLRGNTGHAAPWFLPFSRGEAARARLFCFSYAGGGASMFRGWRDALPGGVDIRAAQLPGRENRVGEPPARRIGPLVDALHEAITPYLDLPYAFYGHSMGALVAFELARRLRRAGAPEPAHLFLAAFRAPQLPNPNIKIHHLPDEVLKTVLRTEGTPQHVLDNEELMRALLPTLRADIELCDTYEYRTEPALATPITVFGGHQDVRVSRSDLEPWQAQAAGPFRLVMLPGSHFFLHSAQDLLLDDIVRSWKGHGHDRPPVG